MSDPSSGMYTCTCHMTYGIPVCAIIKQSPGSWAHTEIPVNEILLLLAFTILASDKWDLVQSYHGCQYEPAPFHNNHIYWRWVYKRVAWLVVFTLFQATNWAEPALPSQAFKHTLSCRGVKWKTILLCLNNRAVILRSLLNYRQISFQQYDRFY